ncbi:hypothetical protein S7711_06877 [Stachybotrys chartarum IBT 7711]|uniref:Phosphatidylinositol N-acetylglucosaminyltransferase subunit H conserved domain-containing protein n=1 Tax=Stachybotrys chartarum (strain CBS 109288 / IBT 7711) TaxID=1280523 RepID=A0A084ANP7_STACB|nr:hypothetical protein S7711_06877 [Stachybotrys chartarum IBT 7711]
MLSSTPRLCIHRPSPTTAEFTVTTLPAPTIALGLLRLLLLLLRLLLASGLGLVVVLRAFIALDSLENPPPLPFQPRIWHILGVLRSSPLGVVLSRAGTAVPLPVFLPAVAAAFYVLSLRVYSQESLLVLRGLGVQTSESSSSYLASTATRFIPTEKIQDIFINEAFRGFEVRYYLVVVVEGEEQIVVVFPGLLPRRHIVETVWREARECLYEGRVEEKANA